MGARHTDYSKFNDEAEKVREGDAQLATSDFSMALVSQLLKSAMKEIKILKQKVADLEGGGN